MNTGANDNLEPDTTGIDIFGTFVAIGEAGFATLARRVSIPTPIREQAEVFFLGLAGISATTKASVQSMDGGAGQAWGAAIGNLAVGTTAALLTTTFLVSAPVWVAAVGSFIVATVAGKAGELVGGLIGSAIDYLIGSIPEVPVDSVVEESRRDRILGNDPGMQARYDNPQYDFQTPEGQGITRAYTDAYARGDLRTAAELLVHSGGENIYPGQGFYPDRIIRQQAGKEGGVPDTPNQQMARDYLHAIDHDNDPNTYPDRIVRQQAGYEPRDSAADRAGGSRSASSPDDVRPGAMGWDHESAADRAGGKSGGADKKPGSPDDVRPGAMGWDHESAADRAGDKGAGGSGSGSGKGGSSSGYGYQGNSSNPPSGGRPSPSPTDNRRDEANRAPDDPNFHGPRPILLDLDGNGVKITEFGNSFQFMTGKDGLMHRTSWAGTGDGVLFYDAGNDNQITEARQTAGIG